MARETVIDFARKEIPFRGKIYTAMGVVFELTEPRIDKKIEELRQATDVYDRVCGFGDQLAELLVNGNFAKELIRDVDQALKTTHASLSVDATWLRAVLGNAEQA